MKRLLSSALIVAALVLPLAARAADIPSYAQPAPPPAGDDRIHGTIRGINGKYGLTVRDSRGYIDNVTMHQGTIINPTGLQLAPGMRVTILGHGDGGTFDANEVDTPYHYEGDVVYPYGYGYPYYPAWNVGVGWGGWGGFRGHFGGRW
ncbi:MAG TPA: hypothetical protein VMA36_11810 [Candidatus Limnocylindria bacterium]|jgi:hypothetical protein|nr:hypothetical protein [Candidatus Limnocylindria bacterium]